MNKAILRIEDRQVKAGPILKIIRIKKKEQEVERKSKGRARDRVHQTTEADPSDWLSTDRRFAAIWTSHLELETRFEDYDPYS